MANANMTKLRAAIDGILSAPGVTSMTQRQIHDALTAEGWSLNYFQVNRALNHTPGLGKAAGGVHRCFNPNYVSGGDEPRWAWFMATPSNPMTHEVFNHRAKIALTSMKRTRDLHLIPAIGAHAVSKGDNDDLSTALTHANYAIEAWEAGMQAGAVKALKKEVEADKVTIDAEKAAISAEKAALAEREAALARREKALTRARMSKRTVR